jgi:predicted negative regulator of RcsB-dependent stress response
MAFQPTPPNPAKAAKTAGADAPAPAPELEHHLRNFWEKYNGVLVWACTAVLLVIVAREGWDYYQARREAGIQAEFAAAATPARQRDFLAAHPDHPLAGVAELQLADAAYAAGRSDEAASSYSQAAATLKEGPFADRARLGLAMAEIQAGRTTEGEAGLRRLVDDTHAVRAVRTEAAYHLASIAAAAGRTAELQRISSELLQSDPNSRWTERVFALQAGKP